MAAKDPDFQRQLEMIDKVTELARHLCLDGVENAT